MSNPDFFARRSTPQNEPLADRVDMLSEELALAVRWQRPSILLAIYKSEFVCTQAQLMLEEKLSQIGQRVYHLTINLEEFDIPLFFSHYPEREKTTFFVKSLKQAGKRASQYAYRALNMRRELLVDYRIRAVFWITEAEAADIPTHAPDFWVFRHRVIEFLDAPGGEEIAVLARSLAGQGSLSRSPARTTEIVKAFEKAARLEPGNAGLWSNLGDLYRGLNRTDAALRALRKATRLDAQDAGLWLRLGDLYRSENRLRDARRAYQAALRIEPDNRNAASLLALCDQETG